MPRAGTGEFKTDRLLEIPAVASSLSQRVAQSLFPQSLPQVPGSSTTARSVVRAGVAQLQVGQPKLIDVTQHENPPPHPLWCSSVTTARRTSTKRDLMVDQHPLSSSSPVTAFSSSARRPDAGLPTIGSKRPATWTQSPRPPGCWRRARGRRRRFCNMDSRSAMIVSRPCRVTLQVSPTATANAIGVGPGPGTG